MSSNDDNCNVVVMNNINAKTSERSTLRKRIQLNYDSYY